MIYLMVVVAVCWVVCSRLVLSVSPACETMVVLEMLLAVRVPVGNAAATIEIVLAVLRAFNPVLLVLACHQPVVIAVVLIVTRLLQMLLSCSS